MKKLVLLMAVAGMFAACNENKTEETTTNVDTTMTPSGDMAVTETKTTTTTYTPAEGDVKRENNMVVVYRNGAWTPVTEKEVAMDNGVVVTDKGEARNADGKVIVIEEGETMSKTGRFFDRTGNAIERGWDATKEGVKDAAHAVGNAAEKAADKTRDAFRKDENKTNN